MDGAPLILPFMMRQKQIKHGRGNWHCLNGLWANIYPKTKRRLAYLITTSRLKALIALEADRSGFSAANTKRRYAGLRVAFFHLGNQSGHNARA